MSAAAPAGVFFVFYWVINVGSLAASLTIPLIMRHAGPHVAFGVPGVCMALATGIFFLGRQRYTCVPASPGDGQPGVVQIAAYALRHHVLRRCDLCIAPYLDVMSVLLHFQAQEPRLTARRLCSS